MIYRNISGSGHSDIFSMAIPAISANKIVKKQIGYSKIQTELICVVLPGASFHSPLVPRAQGRREEQVEETYILLCILQAI